MFIFSNQQSSILCLFVVRLYYVGIYVVMFLEILKTLLRVLSIFSVLIIAFGSAFYILLSEVRVWCICLLSLDNCRCRIV